MDRTLASILMQNHLAGQDRDETYYHPSEATACSLQIYFRKAKARGLLDIEQVPHTPNMMLIFQLGHIIHEWIQGQYVRAGLVDESGIEYPIKDEAHRVTGHIDLWLEREKRVIDIKTASWSSFSKYEIPKYEHRVQTSIYADQVGAEEIEIRYVCKDGGGLDMFLDGLSPAELEELEICATGVDDPMRLAERVTRFKPEPELATQAYEKFARIERSIERGVPPTPEYSPTTRFSPCKSCEFRYACRDLTGRDHPDIGTDEFDLERWIGSSS